MSIPGWLEKLPDGFGVVDTGFDDSLGLQLSMCVRQSLIKCGPLSIQK
jgi:hypothetical protein